MAITGFKRARLVFMAACLTLLSLGKPALAHPYPAQDPAAQVQAGQSIQAAIDAAQPGDQITVQPGIYAEQLTIAKDGITLTGVGVVLVPPATPVQNTCTGLAGNDTNAGICITGSRIELAPFKVEHRKLISLGQSVKDVSVSGFQVNGFDGANIAVVGGENVQITDNWVYNGGSYTGGYGILTVGSADVLVANNAVVLERDLGFIGVCMDNKGAAEVSQNRVSGYYVGLCIQTPGALIAHNDVDRSCIGAFVDPGIDGAKVVHNHIHDINPACASAGSVNGGIIVDGAVNSAVQFNVIEGQSANGTAVGIILIDATEVTPTAVASGNLIGQNVLLNNEFDIFVNTTGAGNEVVSNQCSTPVELCG